MASDVNRPNWYGYSLRFDFVVNRDELWADLCREARIDINGFVSDWLRVCEAPDGSNGSIRVECDMNHLSLNDIHEVIGCYLFREGGTIVKESTEGYGFRPDDDIEWLKQQM